MIIKESLAAVESATFGAHFRRPLYDQYSFARIPAQIRALLTGAEEPLLPLPPLERPDRVVLLVLDAFGWRFFRQYADSAPFLRRAVDEGLVAKLSSQFPSTTTAHLTTIHTGLPVGETGMHEWFMYEPQLDRLIAPILYAFHNDGGRGTLSASGIEPAQIFPFRTFYQQLADVGVQSIVLANALYSHSPYSQAMNVGAQVVSFRTLADGLAELAQCAAATSGPTYLMLYYEGVDSVSHIRGPESPHVAAEIAATLAALEQLHRDLSALPGRTLLLITADHGQTAIDPATAIYLNQLAPELTGLLRSGVDGRPLTPAGSARDYFLYVRDEAVDEAHGLLEERLAGRAEVHRTAALLEAGFFGPAPSQRLRERLAPLVVLPYAGEGVWWYERGLFEQRFYGSHGGLTADEMETLLIALTYVR